MQRVLTNYVGNMSAARSDRAISAALVKVKHSTSHQLQELLERLGRIIEMGQRIASKDDSAGVLTILR
jgi:hypothetical protein